MGLELHDRIRTNRALTEVIRRLFDGHEIKVLAEFEVMHIGWEMDNLGWIIETGAGLRLYVTTNHGRPAVWPAIELQNNLARHERVTDGLRKAVALLNLAPEGSVHAVI